MEGKKQDLFRDSQGHVRTMGWSSFPDGCIRSMSDIKEHYELDAEWFRKNFPLVATEDETDAFCERVAIRVSEGYGESVARFMTLQDLRKRRNGST